MAELTERFGQDFAAARAQIGRVIVGHQEIVEGVLIALFCGGHCLLEGVPGLGKTLLIRSLARALRLSFTRIQFTPDLMPADITGTMVVSEEDDPATGRKDRRFTFARGPIFAQMVLADEINRATPKTQSALLEAMAERSVTVGGVSHALDRPFFVMATQNPLEQEGTYPLPEAQLDRFFFKLDVRTSARAELFEVLLRTTGGVQEEPSPVLDSAQILGHQELVRRVAVAPHVQDYVVRLVLATHPKGTPGGGEFSTPMVDRFVRVGASPRAGQAITLAAKCRALIQGRPAASIDDARSVALAALRHRLILNFEAQAQGATSDEILRNILETLPLEAPGMPGAGPAALRG
ncbi:MAG: AAA family ATPase [Planctomyces sp.]|nr:AAA family ATPase [Planctomyces sp.]MBA4119621.1 AAA family ATPase [Isosphaera sp.]